MYNEPYTGEAIPTYTQSLATKLRITYPFITIGAFNSIIAKLRDIKSKGEIKVIKRSIEITNLSLTQMLKNMTSYKNEREIEAELIRGYIKYGGSGHAFTPIVASGKNGTILHYEHNNSKITTNDLVLIDTGAEYKNYASDISRTYPTKGKYSPKQKQIYNIVLSAHNEVVKNIKPGATYKELQEITKEVLFKGLKDIKLIKTMEQLSNYYYHGVSHSMGLDVHDITPEDGKLKVGNVITVEPGIYIAEKGIGIRLENDILVTESGFDNLSKDIAIDPEEIEEIINK
jgi:Xaa-Pro aminopeptidase